MRLASELMWIIHKNRSILFGHIWIYLNHSIFNSLMLNDAHASTAQHSTLLPAHCPDYTFILLRLLFCLGLTACRSCQSNATTKKNYGFQYNFNMQWFVCECFCFLFVLGAHKNRMHLLYFPYSFNVRINAIKYSLCIIILAVAFSVDCCCCWGCSRFPLALTIS